MSHRIYDRLCTVEISLLEGRRISNLAESLALDKNIIIHSLLSSSNKSISFVNKKSSDSESELQESSDTSEVSLKNARPALVH